MAPADGLSVRGSTRHDVLLPARIAVASEHDSLVMLTAKATGGGSWIKADLVDLSAGGFGFITETPLPRRTLIDIQIFGIGAGDREPMLRAVGRVQRVIMTDRRPAYLVGGVFDRVNSESARSISAIIDELEGNL